MREKKDQAVRRVKCGQRRKKWLRAVVLASCMSVLPAGMPIWADGGQLAGGYAVNDGTTKFAFSDREIIEADSASATANAIELAGSSSRNLGGTRLLYNGSAYSIYPNASSKYLGGIITAANTDEGISYNAVIFTAPDGTKRVAYASDGAVTISITGGAPIIANLFLNGNAGALGTSDLLTVEKQQQLYSIIKSGDTASLQVFLKQYLPTFYLAKINDLSAIALPVHDPNRGTVYASDNYEVNDDNISAQSSAIDTENWRLTQYNGQTLGSQTSSTANTYETQTVAAGSSWQPMDRVAYTQKQTGLFNDTVTVPQYISIDADGNVTFNSSGQGGTVSWTNDQNVTTEKASTDVKVTAITVGTLTTGKNSVIDMTYANTSGSDPVVNHMISYYQIDTATGRYGTYDGSVWLDDKFNLSDYGTSIAGSRNSFQANRILYADQAVLAEGTTFRLGNYGMSASLQHAANGSGYSYDNGYVTPNDYNSAMKFVSGHTDSVYITDASPADDSAGKTNLYIQLGWVPGVGVLPAGDVILNTDNYDVSKGNVPVLLGILKGAENFTVTAQSSKADGVFSVYEITPEIAKADHYFTDPDDNSRKEGTAWYLTGYSFIDTGETSETGKTVSDNAVLTDNLWRTHNENLFYRPHDLHQRFDGQTDDNDNVWAQVWHGQFNGSGYYGRSMSQSWTGYQTGYEKKRAQPIMGGHVYSGVYVDKISADSDTVTGGGDQDALGGGFYTTWVGEKGHYLDLALTALKVKNDYHLYANLGDGTGASGTVRGTSRTYAYGGGIQYGKVNRKAGWYWEPGAALYVGHVQGNRYILSNWLGIQQRSYNTFTGKLKLEAGRQIGEKGQIYAGADLYHEFGSGGGIDAFYGYQNSRIADTGGKDTWWDFHVGGTMILSPVSRAHLDWSRSAGGDAGHEWSVNGRVDFRFGESADAAEKAAYQARTKEGSLYRKGALGEETAESGHSRSNGTVLPSVSLSRPAAVTETKASAAAAAGSLLPSASSVGSRSKDSLDNKKKGISFQGNPPAPAEEAGEQGNSFSLGTVLPSVSSSHPQAVTETATPADAAAESLSAPASSEGSRRDTGESKPEAGGETADTGVSFNGQTYTLGPVTVEAQRPDWEKELSPGTVSVVYTDKYKGEQKDLPAMLQSVPGLYVQKVNGTGHYTVARVRGATGAQVNVYVDGVPMNLNGEAAVNLSAIPVDNVERIEVYRGYVPARFTGAPIGGVINIVTKKPAGLGGSITQGFKSYGGYNATYQINTPLGDGSLLATWQRDIWQGDYKFHVINSNPLVMASNGPLWFDGDLPRRSNDYQNNNGMVKWQDDHWMVKAAYKDLQEDLPTNVAKDFENYPEDSFYGPNGYEKGFWDSQLRTREREFLIGRNDAKGKLGYGWQMSYLDQKKDYLNTGYYRRYAELEAEGVANPEANSSMQDILSPGGLWSHYHSKKWNLDLHTSYRLWSNHLLEFHGDISRESMDADVSGRKTYWSMLENLGLQFIHHYQINEYHFNLQDTITLNDAGDFKATLIGRADRVDMETMSSSDQSWKYSGGAALDKQINEHWGLKTTWGTYNRHPNFYELFGDGATIAPNAGAGTYFGTKGGNTWEHGTQFDFGLNWQGKMLHSHTSTTLTWFDRHAKNQFALWTPMLPNSHSSYFPMDRASVHGIELTHSMQWKRVTLTLSGTWQQPRYSDESALTAVGNGMSYKSTISYTPKWVTDMRLDYLWPGDRFSTFMEWNYMDRQYIGSDPSDARENYWMSSLSTFDVGAKYRFSREWTLSAGVNDLFDKGRDVYDIWYQADGSITRNTPAYPLPGRMYYMTMEYKF